VGISAISAYAQAAEKPLPLKRLRLYETGVAYFERSGRLAQDTGLPVPAAQLDDALKTLVVLAADKNSDFSGLTFNTRVTEQLGRALARLPSTTDSALDFEALARSLIGSQVELVTAKQRQRGRLLQVLAAADSGVERCVTNSARAVASDDAQGRGDDGAATVGTCALRKVPALLFMGDAGELSRIALPDLQQLRPLSADDLKRLRAALQGTSGPTHAHSLQIHGTKAEQITLGYVAEAPLWRTTYRLVLAPGGATLQAWALVHNDSDEAWNGVHMELVNGQPDSFLFPLAAPRYARRRLVTPENELPSVPQWLSGSADELWDRGESDDSIGHGTGSGYGAGAGGFTGRSVGAQTLEGESSLLAIGDLAQHAAATGYESGALFRYELPAPVELAAHTSLLVPLLRESIETARVSYFADDSTTAASAFLLRNTTRQTLPAGTIAVFEAGGFGGETALERMKPGEQRILSFGLDLDVELEHEGRDKVEETRQLVSFDEDRLVEHYVRTQQRRYQLHNRSGAERSLQLGVQAVNNARIEQADAVLVLAHGQVCATYVVAAGAKRAVQLRVVEGKQREFSLSKLTSTQLTALARDPHLPAAQRTQLTAAATALTEHEQQAARKRSLSSEIGLLEASARRTQASLAIVAKADPAHGRKLAAELVHTQKRLDECERQRAAIDPKPTLSAVRRALQTLETAP
jgi:hypothetical protein